MSVSGKAYVRRGFVQESVSAIWKSLPKEGWQQVSCGGGSKGERFYDWLLLPIHAGFHPGFVRSLLIRRSKSKPEELRGSLCFAPVQTSMKQYVEIVGCRWTVETCIKESKSETGLDQYEVHSYDGWYKHITLACIAYALLSVISSGSQDGKNMQQHKPASSSLEGFKKGRNLHV